MKVTFKSINFILLIAMSLTFSNCTAWPAIAALLGLGGKSGGGPPLILPPGSSSSGGGSANDSSTTTDPSTTTTTPTPTTTPTVPALPSSIEVSTVTASGAYPATTVIDINVKFTEAVNVTGTPRLRLNNTVDVNYLSGTGTDTLLFRYTVTSGNGEDIVGLDAASQTSLSLNGGTIQSVATNTDMTLTLPVPGAVNSMGNGKVIVIDTVAPTITSVTSSTTDAMYGLGANITVQIVFSEVINVVGGPPQITLETGTTDRTVNCSTGTGTNTLSCAYTVQTGDTSVDLDYVATNSFALNGATIKDIALNNSSLTLATPGAANSLGANKAIVINTTSPSVTNVTSTIGNGAYTIGQIIPIQVTFSAAVNVTGTPQLTLETGVTDAILNYTSGTGTNTLTFNYTVAVGHASLDLDYGATNSLALNGGTIKDMGNINDATLTLAAPGDANSIGANKAIVIDTVAPGVASVNSSTADGSYKAGQAISIQVNFSEAVNVTGTPQLTLDTGAVVNYASGTGTTTLNFTYTVGAGQTSADLDYQSTGALSFNGGSIFDAAGNVSGLTLATPGAANSLGANKAIIIDTTSPTVTNVNSSSVNGSYRAGQTVSIDVTFSEVVNVTGTPTLTLETGGTDAVVSYASGTGSSTLTFTYIIGVGHTSADLDYQSTTALSLAGGTINDVAGNAGILTLAAPGAANSLGANKAIIIDTTAPTVMSVNSSTADGTYKAGQAVSIQVNFSEIVNVTGTPQLTLETGTQDAVVNYASGTGTNSLTFTYTVSAGHTSADLDYQSTTALVLNGGTINDAAGNASTLTLAAPGAANSLGTNKVIIIDTTGPTVTSVNSSTINGTYKTGQTVSIQVNFDEAVTVIGTPQLTLETGTTDAIVDYASGTGTTTLTFSYTIAAGHTSADLDYQSTTALALNGGTLKDAIGNDATLTLVAPAATNSLGANKAIVIDTLGPTVTNVTSSTPDNSYRSGQAVSIQVVFNENVTVTGTPQLTLETGTTDAVVNYASGSGTNTLTFTYTIGAGHTSSDLDYQSTTALSLNAGTMQDSVGNDATLTLAAPGAASSLGFNKAIVIDTTAPTVLSVNSSTPDGSYKAGQTVSIQVNFSENVTVTGTPQLTLETGGTDAIVNYASGTGTSELTFTYTVGAGHISADLDYLSTTALALNGGTINDVAGNISVLTLAAPGAANSLGTIRAIVIDTTVPTVMSVTSSTADGIYKAGQVISIEVSFSEVVNVSGTPQITLATGGAGTAVNYASGTGSSTLTFTYTVASPHTSADLDYQNTTALVLNGGTISDLATNAATLTLATPGTANSLGISKAIVIDTTVPTVMSVNSSTADGTYKAGQSISIEVNFSEVVNVTGTPQITLATGGAGTAVNYVSGTGSSILTFTYSVGAGHTSADLDYLTTGALALNGGTIRDAALNDATLTLATPGAANSLGISKAIVIDTTGPVVANVTSLTVDGTYRAGQTVSVQVEFNENVTVTGTPQITLATGGAGTAVNYVSGTGTNILTFTYTVGAGHTSADLDYRSTTALSANGGTLQDAVGNDATLTIVSPGAANSLGFNKAIIIDTTAPTVTNVTASTLDGTYGVGQTVSIQVTFSKIVTVTGTPQLTLETGGTDAVVNYASGTGSDTITFTYTIASGHTSADLDYQSTSALALNSGTIQDAVGNDATLTLATPGVATSLGFNKTIVIDAVVPTVTNVTSSTTNGMYGIGQTVSVQVVFSKTVTVTGTPQLTLETGATDAILNYASGTGSNTLTFTYTIASPHTSADLDYQSTSALALNGGTIKDSLNNIATLTLASPGATNSLADNKAIVINTTTPTVSFSAASSSASEATTTVTIPVVLSAVSALSVSVDYTLTGGTATGGGVDYTFTNGTLTFAQGETSKDITFTVVNDSVNEADETVTLGISNPGNATLGATTSHSYTITNDDPLPTVQFAASTSSSGDESSTTRTIEVNLSTASGQTVTVVVTDAGGTATSGTDYTAIGSPLTLTFTAGVTTQNVSIPVIQDLDYEGNETIQLTLSSPTNATIGTPTGHTFTITDDDVGIVSAETMDSNNNGRIDHYKLTFSEAINDSTFPGYSANALGSAQTDWLIAGYAGAVMAHGTAAPEADTANDAVIYIKFTESGASDTDAKPNLTTTATPALVAASAKTIGRLYTASVVEADRAKPVLLSATAQVGTTLITITFSEPVWTASGMPACGAGGDLIVADFIYNDVSGNGSSSIASMGADTCATDMVAIVNSNTALMPSDNNVDTLVATTGIFDAANNNGNVTVRVISATGGPIISSIDLYDTNKNGKIDQAKVTFSIPVTDSTIDDADASRFTIAGNAFIKVDTASSGTGVIASPNNDPGTANDSIVTLFTDDFTLFGTDLKTLGFTLNTGRWMGNGVELQTAASLASVTNDKAPPVILTAVAAENTVALAGVDSDDTLVITFSEVTNKPVINSGNIASIFSLSSSHIWGNITSATWNGAGDILTIAFTGTGSPTIAVGDYITILGTITDTATVANTSVNIQSVNPITGNFSVQAPSISSASSTSTTSIRVVFTEDVNNTEAVAVANYKIALSNPIPAVGGSCSDNSNFSNNSSTLAFSAITKVDDRTYDFTTDPQTYGTSYTLLADKNNIHHKTYGVYSLTCPNNANFIGQDKLRVTAVSCTSLTSLVVTFSKPVNTGMNVAGSAECNTTAECDKRFAIKGIVSGTEIGSLTQAKVLDGTICGGAAANSSKVCITHSLNQSGSIYSLVAANATDTDGFDNSSWGAIQSTAENLQASPKDRASFSGCGVIPQNFVDGPVVSDPFGDGTAFGYLNKYQSKIYIGPNQKGNGATRFNADGSSPENLTFELLKDSTVSRVSASTASAPFSSIGYTGCTANNATGTGCGPNNENGRGLFATGTFSGTEYLFITGANTAGNNDYIYYTPDLDSVLNFNYMDASWTFDNYNTTCNAAWNSSVTQNQVTESIYVFNGKIYWSVPGDGTNRPFAVKIGTLTNEVTCDNTNNAYLNLRYMTGVGRIAPTNPAQADIMGGIFNSFNDRLYFANSGSISYNKTSTPKCIEGSTYTAGICEQNGGIVRSINNNPAGCTNASGGTCTDWVDITPTSTDYRKYFSIGLEAIADLSPAQRPIPAMETFKNNFYLIRNACAQALWDDGTVAGGTAAGGNAACTFSQSCGTTNKNDMTCPAGSEIPQLWKCDPTLSGSATECDSGDWSLVAQNGATGKTNFGDANNTKITLLRANGDYLYVGFDNATTGVEVWRTNIANPATEGNFSQIGGDGFGSGTAITEIYSNISLNSGSIYYIYLSIGKNSVPVRIHRQQNEAAVAFSNINSVSSLLAYINQSNNNHFTVPLGILILLIILYFSFRKNFSKKKNYGS